MQNDTNQQDTCQETKDNFVNLPVKDKTDSFEKNDHETGVIPSPTKSVDSAESSAVEGKKPRRNRSLTPETAFAFCVSGEHAAHQAQTQNGDEPLF